MNNAAENLALLRVRECVGRKMDTAFCEFGEVRRLFTCGDKRVSILGCQPDWEAPRPALPRAAPADRDEGWRPPATAGASEGAGF